MAANDLDGDGKADILTSPGRGQQPRVRGFDGQSALSQLGFLGYAVGFHGGVFVASRYVLPEQVVEEAIALQSESQPTAPEFAQQSALLAPVPAMDPFDLRFDQSDEVLTDLVAAHSATDDASLVRLDAALAAEASG